MSKKDKFTSKIEELITNRIEESKKTKTQTKSGPCIMNETNFNMLEELFRNLKRRINNDVVNNFFEKNFETLDYNIKTILQNDDYINKKKINLYNAARPVNISVITNDQRIRQDYCINLIELLILSYNLYKYNREKLLSAKKKIKRKKIKRKKSRKTKKLRKTKTKRH